MSVEKPILQGVVALTLIGLLAACAGTLAQRLMTAEQLAEAGHLAPRHYSTPIFTISGWLRSGTCGPLGVFIEGDGFAWIDSARPSSDPTPRDPIGLRMAVVEKAERVLYVGRPCQYGGAQSDLACDSRIWTSHRFAPEVVDALDRAIDMAKDEVTAGKVSLVGFSGGGTMAALLAARRNDVDELITVAAPLDLAAWSAWHHMTPLNGSLDPAGVAERWKSLPQSHFVGTNDEVVPPEFARTVAAHLGLPLPITVPGIHHAGRWDSIWKEHR